MAGSEDEWKVEENEVGKEDKEQEQDAFICVCLQPSSIG